MTQEDKKLLLKDLCSRLQYKPHCRVFKLNGDIKENDDVLYGVVGDNVMTLKSDKDECLMYYQIKPYLRPMSSMTEEEENDLKKITWQFHFDRKFNSLWIGAADDGGCMLSEMTQIITYLISHHFDYCGLIEKGFALEAPEDMYNN